MDRRQLVHAAKKDSERYWPSNSFRNSEDDTLDIEKRPFIDDDDDEESISSSRATSHSFEPMLRYARSTPQIALRKASAYTHRLPMRKFNRYFTIVLATGLVLFIITLHGLSRHSARVVEDRHVPPPPPAYEKFPFLTRYHGGLRTLVPRSENIPEYPNEEEEWLEMLTNTTDSENNQPVKRALQTDTAPYPRSRPFEPYGDQASKIQECFLDKESKVRIPKVRVYDGIPRGFPDNVIGSYEVLGLDNEVCFDRFGRLGPYGLGYGQRLGGTGAGMEGDTEGADQVWTADPEVDYRTVRWADVQQRCADANHHRFKGAAPSFNQIVGARPGSHHDETSPENLEDSYQKGVEATVPGPEDKRSTSSNELLPRTVILIRTWNDYQYDPEDILYLRALISELSIGSGTEYTIHFLVHVHNNDIPIFSDEEVYEKTLNESIPEEFRGMASLWSDKQLQSLYTGLNESKHHNIHLHGAYRSSYMPVQWFSHQHPEYDFIWHWEMDARYTGHYYHLFDSIDKWAKAQPRKGLWERNARFYVPAEHGSWEDFSQMVRVHTQHGTNSKSNLWSALKSPATDLKNTAKSVEKPIWGPESPELEDLDTSNDPNPPTSYDKDNYEWGVGEDADLITLNPLFDPDQTGWILADDVTGYDLKKGLPPRRTAIIAASRLSRRLLKTMHEETSRKFHTMFTEMWPGSCALHHGYKAVYAPHPVFIDRRWPTDYLAAIFNGGRNGASGGAWMSIFTDDHQVNFRGTTWYYNAGFAPNLWKRWLGYKVDNDGGEEWELSNEGRMCVPGMLLHPVKQVNLVYEH